MAGIYLHIPFCKQACHYCNFHFSTSLKSKDLMVAAIVKEIKLQKDFLGGAKISSIYLGGGTPSLLEQQDLNLIFDSLNTYHIVEANAEITLEANPDDLTKEKLNELKDTPINRLSIGIQSFSEADLQFMNRAHNAGEARAAIDNAKAAGFENLTIDLIYGTPTTSNQQWKENMEIIFDYGIPHISCYCLTVEPQTALGHFVAEGKAPAVDEEQSARQFEMLMEAMSANGYVHYEISNFAKPGFYAKHNSNYWLGVPYLGLGPSAHSFDTKSRQWNIANNAKYIKAIDSDTIPYEKEVLRPTQKYNEYVMTSLRTIWGIDSKKIKDFGPLIEKHFYKNVQFFIESETILKKEDHYCITNKGRLLADHIAMELFLEEA